MVIKVPPKNIEKEPLKIGVLIDFHNGDEAFQVLHDTMELVFDEAYESGLLDRKVEIVVKVAEGLPRGNYHTTLKAYKELVEAGVLCVHGPKISENAITLRQYVDTEGHVPCVAMVGSDRWYGEWCFCVNNGSLTEEPYMMTNYLRTQGLKNIAVVYDESAIGEELLGYFRKAARSDGIKILGEKAVSHLEEDLTDAAMFLKEKGGDAAVYLGFGISAVRLNKAFEKISWTPPHRLMSSSFMTAPALPEGVRSLMGWVGIDQYDEENVVAQAFLDRFEKRYGYRPQNFWSVLNYDITHVIAQALSNARPLSPMGVKAALESIKLLPAAAGGVGTTITFGPYMRSAWRTKDFLVFREPDPDFTGEPGRLGPPGTILRHRYNPLPPLTAED